MPTRLPIVLLVLATLATSLLPTPALVLGDDAGARTMACVPGQPCSMPDACSVSGLTLAVDPPAAEPSHGCCSTDAPSSALPADDDDSCSRCRCFAVGALAIVTPTGFAIEMSTDPAVGNPRAERPSRTLVPETPPPRRSL